MCCKHCRSQGGCTYNGHHNSLSAQPLSSPPVPTPPLLDPSSHQSHSTPVTQNDSSLDAATESSMLLSLGQKSPLLSQIDPSLLLDSGLPSLPLGSLPDVPPPPPSLPAPLPLPLVTSAVTPEFSGNPHYKSHLRSYAAEHVAATLRRTELKQKNDAEQAKHCKLTMEYVVAFSFSQVSFVQLSPLSLFGPFT